MAEFEVNGFNLKASTFLVVNTEGWKSIGSKSDSGSPNSSLSSSASIT